MLRGAIQPPLSPKKAITMPQTTAKPPPASHQEHKDIRILPLTRRPLLQRLDVLPFLLGYSILILLDTSLDVFLPIENSIAPTVIDVIYLLLLICQLILFLKCQWCPEWRAFIAFRANVVSGGDGRSKVEGMKQWTHCLVLPPQSYEKEAGGIVPVSVVVGSSEEDSRQCCCTAVVHFRGLTYRCCVNVNSLVDVNVDLEMESIWKSSGYLEDIDEEVEDMDGQNNNHHVDTKAAVSREPHFHRLHFPIDLPLSFYASWSGHDSKGLAATLHVYGRNLTHIPLPSILSLLSQQLLQPLFLFQLFCVILWSLDEYWMYALFTLFSLVMFELTMAYNRWKGVKRLREEVAGGVEEEEEHRSKQIPLVECFRTGEWVSLPPHQLVVGDIVSLVSSSGQRQMLMHDHEMGTSIPADLLLLSGRAVVNEAMLTGESVPQVKEAIESKSDKTLDLSQGHKRSVLFGGTVLMDHHTEDENGSFSSRVNEGAIPPPPNNGIVCFVLRTGFDTIQGSLLRSLAYRAESGGGNAGGGEGVNSTETFIFLGLLLLFALISASTIVQHAWGDVTRNHFKLILHVIIIITSVIPPELPMELSLAVTTSLSELVKRCQVYCTEPYRIPLAGLVDTCCFDKTGTLTSDELRLHGVCLPDSPQVTNGNDGDEGLILFDDIASKDNDELTLPRQTLRVMVGCQSLATTYAFVPGRDGRTTVVNKLVGDPLEKAVMDACSWTLLPGGNDTVVEMNQKSSSKSSIRILHRFAFSSTLRRMSVLAIDTEDTASNDHIWALTKGSPETIMPCIDPKSFDQEVYSQLYKRQMALGRRVLALAYQNLGKNTVSNLDKWKSSRDLVERNLVFAGLLIMDSPLKADSSRIIKELRAGQQTTVMVTGDAALTAAEVARRVGIIDAPENATFELCHSEQHGFRFLSLNCSGQETCFNFTHQDIENLGTMVKKGHAAVCMTGDVLSKLAMHAVHSSHDNSPTSTKDYLNHPAAKKAIAEIVPIISVFARHEPRHKEAVISAFNSIGRHTLMCGDGSNDIGALKQAHVGVSIISVPDVESKQRDALDGIKSKKKRKDKKSKRQDTRQVESYLQALAEAEDELMHVSLGNASVASPFTARKTSIRCCKDILQQGRCTLVTMIQIYKILGVNCLVTALVLTKLHQVGVKQGDRQMTAQGVVIAGLFLFVTRGKPIPRLSKQKPPSSILCATTLISMAFQFAVHFAMIMTVTNMSQMFVDPFDPSTSPDGPFVPNTLNTSTFLVTMLSMINTFVVNYTGRPFVEDLHENKMLFRSIIVCYGAIFVCAMDFFPPLNDLLQLSSLPSENASIFSKEKSDLINYTTNVYGFRTVLSALMFADTAGVMCLESLVRRWSN